MTDIQERLATGKGKFTPRYPDLGTGAGELRGLRSHPSSSRPSARRCSSGRGSTSAGSSGCRGRARYFTRELPGRLASIVVARDLDGDRPRLPQRLRPPRQQGRVAGAPAARSRAARVGSSPASTTAGATASTGASRTSPTSDEFFDLDKSTLRMPKVHCEVFAGFVFVNLSQDPGAAAHLPRRPHRSSSRRIPFERMTQRYGFSTPHQRQLEARRRLGLRVVPPAVRPRPVHRPATCRRPRRWCRRSTRTTTTCSRRTC